MHLDSTNVLSLFDTKIGYFWTCHMVSVKNGKTQAIGKALLQQEIWSLVEKMVIMGHGTRMIAYYVLAIFPELKAHYRFEENPEYAKETLARLIRYHMQDSLRIDFAKYTEDPKDVALFLEMMPRFQFDWRAKQSPVAA